MKWASCWWEEVSVSQMWFGATEMTFLRCTFSPEGTRPLEERVVAVNGFQQPVLVKDLRHFLGMLNFYGRFMPKTASIQASLHAAVAVPTVKWSQPVEWTSTMVQAFEDCKASFSRATFLAHLDPSTTLTLFTDASDIAISVAFAAACLRRFATPGFLLT